MKIYTKMGDAGKTMLANGEMTDKTAERIEAYGTIDELNSFLGLLIASLKEMADFGDVTAPLIKIQMELFDIGSELATPGFDENKQCHVTLESVGELESLIDKWSAELKPLTNFILPGGDQAGSLAHVCRTICRRAERRTLALHDENSVRSETLVYLNRLSDLFFTLARLTSARSGKEELLWKGKDRLTSHSQV